MKVFLVLVVIGAWLVAIYFGWIHFIGKTMRPSSEQDNPQPAETLQLKGRQQADDLRERQKQLMLDRQSRIRDLQRR